MAKCGRKRAAGGEKFGKHQRTFGTLVTLEIPQNRQSFVWKSLEQNTRVLEKLGKRLGGRLYSAAVGSCHQRPPIERDRHCEERSCEATQGSFRTEKESGWPVSSKGTGRRPLRNLQMTARENCGYFFPKTGLSVRFKILSIWVAAPR